MEWIELTADYRCNNRCTGCYSVQEGGPSMSGREALETLAWGRGRGARGLWLGGGEPTLRPDLFALVAAARKLGYERVKLQTNGMMLAYPDYVRRAADAGVTEVNFSIKGATAATHDRLTRTPGCHDLMIQGMANVRETGLPMEGDILLYRSNLHELVPMVERYAALGIARFHLWLMAAVDTEDEDVISEVPRIADVMPQIVAATDLRLSPRRDFITSLHTPPCTVPRTHHACLFRAADLEMIVANPGGHRFRLEESPIEGGAYLDRCARCSFRLRCGGLRRDYLRLHGDDEFQPVP